jgi:hypothetical protein
MLTFSRIYTEYLITRADSGPTLIVSPTQCERLRLHDFLLHIRISLPKQIDI